MPEASEETENRTRSRANAANGSCQLCDLGWPPKLSSMLPTPWVFQAYKRKTEAAKKEYLKALAAYRASLVSKVTNTWTLGTAR